MNKPQRIIYIVLASVIFMYLAIRSYTVCIVNDEAATFFNFIRTGVFFPFMENYYVSANNHILNSLLGWVSYSLLGADEWVIRLPSLLSFGLYSWAVYQLGRYIQSGYLRWYFYILLLGSHYLVEFFAYSRGYGMGMAFLASAILFLAQFALAQRPSYKVLYLGVLCMVLATLANLNLLLSLLIWGFAALIIIIKNFGKLRLVALTGPVAIYIGFVVLFIIWSFDLREHSELYFGNGRMLLTLFSLIAPFSLLNEHDYYPLFVAFIALASGAGIWAVAKSGLRSIQPFHILVTLFILNVAGLYAMHHLLDVRYPSARTALHLYFLFAAMVPFVFDQLRPRLRAAFTILSLVIYLPILAYSLLSVNTYQSASHDWQMEQIPNEFYTTLVQMNQGRSTPYSMQASSGFFTFILGFQDFQQGNQLAVCDEFPGEFPMYVTDIAIIDTALFPGFKQQYKEILHDPHSGKGLYLREPLLQSTLVADSSYSQKHFSQEGFTTLLSTPVPDSLAGRPFRVDYELVTTSEKIPMPAVITLELKDSTGQMTWYKQQRIDYHYGQAGSDTLRMSFVKDYMPENTVLLRTFFWNLHGHKFVINWARVKFHELKE